MCGKTHGVSGGNKLRYDPNDPMSLIETLLNDPKRKRLWEDRPGEYVDPNNPSRNRDPSRGSNLYDPAPPIDTLRDIRTGGGNDTPRDIRTGGGNDTPRDIRTGSGNDTPRDIRTGGGNDTLRDIRTGGGNDTLRDIRTGGTASGLTATERPRDPRTRGTDRLPSGSMLTLDQTIAYLGERNPGLSRALGSFA